MFFWYVSSQTAVLLLTYIVFALPAFAATALFVKAVVIIKAVVLIIFTVYIKGFKRLLKLLSVA
jgi:hypothetical protein